jgi:hypothetical protein
MGALWAQSVEIQYKSDIRYRTVAQLLTEVKEEAARVAAEGAQAQGGGGGGSEEAEEQAEELASQPFSRPGQASNPRCKAVSKRVGDCAKYICCLPCIPVRKLLAGTHSTHTRCTTDPYIEVVVLSTHTAPCQ